MKTAASCAALLCLCASLGASPDLPVFFLKYDAGIGSEESADEQEVEASSHRHEVSLRIKEAWSRRVTSNLYTVVTRKGYLDGGGSYTYVSLNPDTNWSITDSVKWYLSGRSKWMRYDEPDAEGLSKDYVSFLAKTTLTIAPHRSIKIIPLVQGSFEVYENPGKTRQSYTYGIGIDSRVGHFVLGGDYRGTARFPLGGESTVGVRLSNEFGIDLTWDPND